MQYFRFFVVVSVSLFLIACNSKPAAVKILFVEQEADVESYQTRLIVTKDFMRFDDGENSVDFVLFDRKTNIIYSTNSDEQTVMSVVAKETADIKPPIELKQHVNNLGILKDAPAIQSKPPLHYQFFTNETLCYDVVAIKDLMPDVVKAMQAFKNVLASDSQLTFQNIPADVLNACDISMSTFAAGRHLQYGFPVQEWTPNGTGRTLVDFDINYKVNKKLFELPEDYQQYSLQDFRQGKVKFSN